MPLLGRRRCRQTHRELRTYNRHVPKAFWKVNLNATRGGLRSAPTEFRRSEARRHVKLFLAARDGNELISDAMVPDYLVSESMIDRFLELDPPVFRIMAEYDTIFAEIEHAYVRGEFFSALSAAVVTIERILNGTRIALHPHISPKIKRLWNKGSLPVWQPNIEALQQWGCLSPELGSELEQLYEVRCNYLHSGDLASLEADARRTVRAAYDLSKEIIGFPPRLFSLGSGIECLNFNDPVVQVLYRPHLVMEPDEPAG